MNPVRAALTCVALLALAPVFGSSGAAHAQNTDSRPVTPIAPVRASLQPAAVPWGPGERFTYKVKWGFLTLGQGSLAVPTLDTVRGVPSYHIQLRMKGGKLGMNVDDDFSSWLGVEDLSSRRFVQDIHEIRYKALREYEIYPEEGRWERLDRDESGETQDANPLDEVSFIYWARTLPLEVGESYEYSNYFKDTGNPVVLNVLRKETIEVPAGTFETIVVQPIIKTKGLFSQDGEAEMFFTDDERRMLVRLETKMSVGNLSLHLEGFQEGRALAGMVKADSSVGNE